MKTKIYSGEYQGAGPGAGRRPRQEFEDGGLEASARRGAQRREEPGDHINCCRKRGPFEKGAEGYCFCDVCMRVEGRLCGHQKRGAKTGGKQDEVLILPGVDG